MNDDEGKSICSNCKKLIENSKFVLHEIYCLRNVIQCSKCTEMVDKSELEEHNNEKHKLVECKDCKQKFEVSIIESHNMICDKKPKTCKFCECPIKAEEYDNHLYTCGSRTRKCPTCQKNILVRDLELHQDLCLIKQQEEMSKPKPAKLVPNSNLGSKHPPIYEFSTKNDSQKNENKDFFSHENPIFDAASFSINDNLTKNLRIPETKPKNDAQITKDKKYNAQIGNEKKYDAQNRSEKRYDAQIGIEKKQDPQISKEKKYDPQIGNEMKYDSQIGNETQFSKEKKYDPQIGKEKKTIPNYDFKKPQSEIQQNKLGKDTIKSNKPSTPNDNQDKIGFLEKNANPINIKEENLLSRNKIQKPTINQSSQGNYSALNPDRKPIFPKDYKQTREVKLPGESRNKPISLQSEGQSTSNKKVTNDIKNRNIPNDKPKDISNNDLLYAHSLQQELYEKNLTRGNNNNSMHHNHQNRARSNNPSNNLIKNTFNANNDFMTRDDLQMFDDDLQKAIEESIKSSNINVEPKISMDSTLNDENFKKALELSKKQR